MAGIIKANQITGNQAGVQTIAFNLSDMKDSANVYTGKVRDQAARIISSANDQAEKVRHLAAQQGLDEAKQSARQAAVQHLDQRLQTLMPALQQNIEQIQQERVEWLGHWEANAVRLAVAIAERIIRRELSQQPEITLDLVHEALELAAGSEQVKIHLNPQDVETLGQQADAWTGQLSRCAPSDIVADESVSPGGCVVKTEFGEIDQQIESQLVRMEEELT